MPRTHTTPAVIGLAQQTQDAQATMITAPGQKDMEIQKNDDSFGNDLDFVNSRCLMVSCGVLAGVAVASLSTRASVAPSNTGGRILKDDIACKLRDIFKALKCLMKDTKKGEKKSKEIASDAKNIIAILKDVASKANLKDEFKKKTLPSLEKHVKKIKGKDTKYSVLYVRNFVDRVANFIAEYGIGGISRDNPDTTFGKLTSAMAQIMELDEKIYDDNAGDSIIVNAATIATIGSVILGAAVVATKLIDALDLGLKEWEGLDKSAEKQLGAQLESAAQLGEDIAELTKQHEELTKKQHLVDMMDTDMSAPLLAEMQNTLDANRHDVCAKVDSLREVSQEAAVVTLELGTVP